ncbi:unnamed protein product [Paramecium pentaurelia]|uniref:Transmembrane protein n=1 Tax=Paramecium pentaurelia TaxID=43138 RepID=A0A8S1X8Y3_9CILI|nr:unnamed protein product [Paramecium pentaurelia]
MQHYAYKSKFLKFYTIRIIQICEQQTLKIGLKQIREHSNRQSKINKKNKNNKSKEQVYRGEIYISTRKYIQILSQFPKLTQNINLSDHLKKKIGSNSQITTNVKEKISFIIEKKNQEQEILYKKGLQNLKNHRSIRGGIQIINSITLVAIQKSIIEIKVLMIIAMTALIVTVFLRLIKLR